MCSQHLAFESYKMGPFPQAHALMGEVGEALLHALCSSAKSQALSPIGPSLALVSEAWP